MAGSSGQAESSSALFPLLVRDLGVIGYEEAMALQGQVHQQVVEGEQLPTLLLLEHRPVITISRRPGVRQNLLAGTALLEKLGIAVAETDRGGDITYHGPGQLVAYPIVPLAALGLNVGRYMRLLEQAVIETLGVFGIHGQRETGATGVWVTAGAGARAGAAGPGASAGAGAASLGAAGLGAAKICAMGIRVRRGVTLHGLALNVTTDLTHFQTIVPCGLTGRPVTSVAQLLGAAAPAMGKVKEELAGNLQRCFDDCAAAGRAAEKPPISTDEHR